MLPISDRHLDYAREAQSELRQAGVRPELDERTESVGRKIRDAELRKIPYMLVVGDREAQAGEVAVRAASWWRPRRRAGGGVRGARPQQVENPLCVTISPLYSLSLISFHHTPRGTA